MEKWIEARVAYDSEDKSFASDMISNIFYDIGLQGVVMEDPEVEVTEGWVDETLHMPVQYAVIGYFPKDERAVNKCNLLEEKLSQLKLEMGIISQVVYRQIDSEDWTETWKAFFEPLKISDQIIIKPTWREYHSAPGEIVIELDPGMAFGTGSHPTTRLCIHMIERYLNRGESFLDVGTGSGILLITAAKLGAKKGLGIDMDKEAVKLSRKNLVLNKIETSVFRIRTGTRILSIKDRYDMVVANILPGVILSLLDDMDHVLTPDGIFICSGFLEEHVDQIREKLMRLSYAVLEERVKETWVAIAGTKRR